MNHPQYENLMEHWIENAIKHYGNSDGELKKHSVYAAQTVGTYQNGSTQAIADGILRSPSTVENYAHAHVLYVKLRNSPLRNRFRTLWRTLPISHWYQAWIIEKAGFDGGHYLYNAALNKWSGREMMENYKKDLEAGNAPMIFRRGVIALHGIVNELLTKYNPQLSEAQRIALLTVVDAFELEAIEQAVTK